MINNNYMFIPTAFITMPRIITGPGQYITRGGETITIDSMLDCRFYGAVGRYSCGTNEKWGISGRIFAGMTSNNDVVRPA